MKRRLCAAASLAVLAIAACSRGEPETKSEANAAETAAPAAAGGAPAAEKARDDAAPAPAVAAPLEPASDKFTYANYNEVRVTHADFELDVLFDDKVLEGTVILDVERLNADADRLVLDTDDLDIRKVETNAGDDWSEAQISLGADDPVLGSRLEIPLPSGAEKVRIEYRTSPGAAGLQWLAPEQTAGGEHPYLFSQNQAIHARSMAPLQDTPAVRMTYEATIHTPDDLIAVMSAEQDPDGARDGEYTFSMPQPIPSYLIAIAAGDIDFKAINDHIGVYAEAEILDAAAAEFEDTPQMEDANAALYGPYRWGRYDMLVLPPSFPFGGMENPRLTFLTPTLIAGDKSLTNVVAHELAHSWSGNLVTNATWRDAWLNEGFTSYVENRIMEALYGDGRATMERALDLEALKRDVGEAERPELTQLKMPADLAHPEDAFTQVSYVKGAFFLKFLEQRFGRDAFDPFLKDYFNAYAFKAITTEDFLNYLRANLMVEYPDALSEEEITTWVYEPGVPDLIENPASTAFENVSAAGAAWLSGENEPADLPVADWSTHEWLHFVNTLPDDLTTEQMAALDDAFDLSESRNAEIAYAWYMQSIKLGYEPAFAPLEQFLMRVGRGKFIYRLYQALEDNDRTDWAKRVYSAARPGYHPIAQRRIDAILDAG